MKKTLILMFVLLLASAAKAQLYVGGSLNIWGSDEISRFGVAPEVGYNLSDHWAVGGVVRFEHAKNDGIKTNAFALSPYARYTFFENKLLSVFAEGNLGFSTVGVKGGDNTNGFEIGVRPGLAIKIGRQLAILTKVGFFGYRDDYLNHINGGGLNLSGEDLSFGLYCSF